jgi:hypothetical protein
MSNLGLRFQILDPQKRNTLHYFIAHHDLVNDEITSYLPLNIVDGSLIIGDRTLSTDYTLPPSRAPLGEYHLTSSAVIGGEVDWKSSSNLAYTVVDSPAFTPPTYSVPLSNVAIEIRCPPFTTVILPTASAAGYGKIYIFRKVGGGDLVIRRATGSTDMFDREITDIKLYADVYVKMISNGVDGWFLL